MESLVVRTYSDGTLVVDSRLVAQDLGIQHETFYKTLITYQTTIESAFGILRFEIGEIAGRGQPEKFVSLTEDQAMFAGTLSRNTERVVAFKAHLVKAFSLAKQQLQPKSPYELISMLASAGAEIERRVNAVESKLQEMEAIRQAAEEQMTKMPEAVSTPAPLHTRAAVNMWMKSYITSNNLGTGAYKYCWDKLYSHFNHRYGYNLEARRKSGNYQTKLDVVADLGLIDELYALAQTLYPKSGN